MRSNPIRKEEIARKRESKLYSIKEFADKRTKYLNNLVEQDHRGVKRITNAMLGFKSFESASITLNGIEIVHTLRKGQPATQDISAQSLAKTFYSLAP